MSVSRAWPAKRERTRRDPPASVNSKVWIQMVDQEFCDLRTRTLDCDWSMPDLLFLMLYSDLESLLRNSILPLCVLPFCIIFPFLMIVFSLRLNFHLQASFLLFGVLLGSFLAGMTGLKCFYKHLAIYFDWTVSVVPSTILTVSDTQEFARTFLSTCVTSIFIVKFLSKAMATRETVNNSGIGFFILMIFAKFCCVFILPNVKFYSFKTSGQTVSFQMFELLECFVDIICLASSLVFTLVTCNMAGASVQPLTSDPVHEDSLPVTQPLQLPSFLAMSVNRVLLLISLQIQYKFEKQFLVELVIQDMFVVMHALVSPLLTLATHPDMRRQVIQLIRRKPEPEVTPGMEMFSGSGRRGPAEEDEDSQDTDSEAGSLPCSRSVQARRASHRPDSAPTRPSSASTAPGSLLPGGVSESAPRRPYRSNLRSVSSTVSQITFLPISLHAGNTDQLWRQSSRPQERGSLQGRRRRRAGPWTG